MSNSRFFSLLVVLGVSVLAYAQEYTYNHDSSVMNQFTVQETGVGSLTPEWYYDVFHHRYKDEAKPTNKNAYRLSAAAASYRQVSLADSISSYMNARAKIEALNVADRSLDVAYVTENPKLSAKLDLFKKNLDVLKGYHKVSADEKEAWSDLANTFDYAIRVTHNCYMPNSERQQQYGKILEMLTADNKLLCMRIKYFRTLNMLSGLNHVTHLDSTAVKTAVNQAYDNWKGSWSGHVNP